MDIFDKLAAPFPSDKVSWRVGSTNKDKTKGLALAYIDARDVMARLDEVVGPENWQDRYEVHGGKTICYISICQRAFAPGFRDSSQNFPEGVIEFLRSNWVTKADGAGDSDVEAEKGAISDAFKRAAVKWGVGRYLYDVEGPWVALNDYKQIEKSEYPKLRAILAGKPSPRREAPTGPTPEEKANCEKAEAKVAAIRTELATLDTFQQVQWIQDNPTQVTALQWIKRNYPDLYAEIVGLGVEV